MVKHEWRLYCEMALQLCNKSPKRCAQAKLREGRSATRPREVWAMDFIHDQLFGARKIRCLTVVDICSRLSPVVDVRRIVTLLAYLKSPSRLKNLTSRQTTFRRAGQ